MKTENTPQAKKLTTPKGKSYWDNNGAYQKQYDLLNKQLVPASGEADTVNGEMVRAIGRLFYEFCNNGNGNAVDVKTETETTMERVDCTECGGDGEKENDEGEMESCTECDGSGHIEEEQEQEVDGEVEIDEYYQDMLNFLCEFLPNDKVVKDVEKLMLNKRGNHDFGKDEMSVYNALCDEVMYFVLTTENVARSEAKAVSRPVKSESKKSETPKSTKKPIAKLIGEDDNVFNLIGICGKTLKRAGLGDQVPEMQKKVIACKSYHEALSVMGQYCDLR